MNEFQRSYGTIEWRVKAERIFQRDNYTCKICGKQYGQGKWVRLVAHHITYENCHGVAYGCPDKDLITVCHDCHKNIHKKTQKEEGVKMSVDLAIANYLALLKADGEIDY